MPGYCSSCGVKLIEGSQFCSSCGKNINEPPTISTQQQGYAPLPKPKGLNKKV